MKTCKTQSVVLMGRGKGAGGGEKLIPKLNPQLIIFLKENQRFSARVRASTAPFKYPFNFPSAHGILLISPAQESQFAHGFTRTQTQN